MKEAPADYDVINARNILLEELIVDFPFVDSASRANALALFLLPFVRGLIDGPTPLHHVDAPQEGTGKSLLIQTWGHVALGHEPKALGEVSRPDDWQKLILSALLEAPREIFLDNLNNTLDSGALASALTSDTVGGRQLGTSRMVAAPVKCVWLSSGNNVRMSRELLRRTLYIRLDAKGDTARLGRRYKHKLPKWAKQNRGELAWACLTICQAWVAAGKVPGRSLINGYEAWSAVMDGILQNAGITDLAANSDAFRQNSVDAADEWPAFVAEWWDRYRTDEVLAANLVDLANEKEMLGGVLEHASSKRGQSSALSGAITKIRDRTYGEVRVIFGVDGKNRKTYRLQRSDGTDSDAEPEDAIPL